jgi:cadmium resistance protein CadD (predicted permease)
MDSGLSSIALAIIVFASTNIDDIFLLSALFADQSIKRRSVVIGQFVGIGVLVLASLIAARLALTIPDRWIALLGLAPLFLGLSRLAALRHQAERQQQDQEETLAHKERRAERQLHSQALAVTAVIVANGADNLGAYIPLFVKTPAAVPVYIAVFLLMTGAWCLSGYALVRSPVMAGVIRRYGHVALPFVLIALGLYILSGAASILRQ